MDNHEDKLADLNRMIEEQDRKAEQAEHRHAEEVAALADRADVDEVELDDADDDRLRLLDRIADRLPDLDLDVHEHRWGTLPDGSEALIVEGGGFDGGPGYFIANSPDPTDDDVHVIGPTAPMFPGKIGAVAVHADGTRELVRLIDDPLDGWRGEGDE